MCGDLTVLNLSQPTAKQDDKKPTTLPFVPDNPDGRISELLLLDTTDMTDTADTTRLAPQ